jgi:DNA (cytosine-5)-methyltransferase 1
MERKYKLLDLFCCAGGCAKGYADAGFEVIGVDIVDRPNYPYEFIKADALEILKDEEFIKQFDAIHASPPCQCYSKLKYLSGNVEKWEENHVDLVAPTRELLIKTGKPYVIENVEGSPLINPIKLCGSQFENMYTQRPRLFESNIPLRKHDAPVVRHKTLKLGQGPAEDGYITVAGTRPPKGMNEVQAKLYYGFALGGIDWMSLEELTQAIPPSYTEFIGKQIIEYLENNIREQKRETFNTIQEMLLSREFIELVKKYMAS